MKMITAYRLKSEKKGNLSKDAAIFQSKLHDIQDHLHVMLLEAELLGRKQTAVLNSQFILDYLERVDKSLQSLHEHFSLSASVIGKERVGKALSRKGYK